MTAEVDKIERLRKEIQALISLREARGDFQARQVSLLTEGAQEDTVVCVRWPETLVDDHDFIQSIWELLLDLPRETSVTLLMADPDTGKPLQPPRGVRITTNGPELFPEHPPIDETARRIVEQLHRSVARILAAHGREDPYGNGDYWIVDGWLGPYSCKVCVWKIKFLTPSLVDQIQDVLRQKFRGGEVIFALDLVDAPEDLPPGGITVTRDHIQQDWDKSRLRHLYGPDFQWD